MATEIDVVGVRPVMAGLDLPPDILDVGETGGFNGNISDLARRSVGDGARARSQRRAARQRLRRPRSSSCGASSMSAPAKYPPDVTSSATTPTSARCSRSWPTNGTPRIRSSRSRPPRCSGRASSSSMRRSRLAPRRTSSRCTHSGSRRTPRRARWRDLTPYLAEAGIDVNDMLAEASRGRDLQRQDLRHSDRRPRGPVAHQS